MDCMKVTELMSESTSWSEAPRVKRAGSKLQFEDRLRDCKVTGGLLALLDVQYCSCKVSITQSSERKSEGC